VQSGKGQKSRSIPISDRAYQALADWMALREQLQPEHEQLFVIEVNRRFGNHILKKVMDQAKAMAGMKGDRRIQPHSIRHAAATALLRKCGDIKSVQEWLGHANMTTTAIYLHVDEEQMRRVVNMQAMPLPEEEQAPPAAQRPSITSDVLRRRRKLYR
jgi:site-specific recombinase XerD